MSDDFPTHAEIGEENVRDYLRRTGDLEEIGCIIREDRAERIRKDKLEEEP